MSARRGEAQIDAPWVKIAMDGARRGRWLSLGQKSKVGGDAGAGGMRGGRRWRRSGLKRHQPRMEEREGQTRKRQPRSQA